MDLRTGYADAARGPAGGGPPLVKPQGIDIAGRPVRLNAPVKRVSVNVVWRPSSSSGGAATGVVGTASRSKRSKTEVRHSSETRARSRFASTYGTAGESTAT